MVSRNDAPDIIYAVLHENGDLKVVLSDEDNAYEHKGENERVVTYEKAGL